MVEQRKIKCDCGGMLVEKTAVFGTLETKALVCNKCGFTTLTKKQAEKYVKLKQLHQIVDAERKIIKIGNSMGITLPDQLQAFGAKIGGKIKTTALNDKAFSVELVN